MKHSKKAKKPNIALVAEPVGRAGIEILTMFIKIFEELSENLYVITGNFPKERFLSPRIHIENVENDLEKQARGSRPAIIRKFIAKQIKLSLPLIKVSRKIDSVVFIGLSPVLPMFVARILRKKAIKVVAASLAQGAQVSFGTRSLIYHLAAAAERLSYALSERIAVVGRFELDKYRDKVLPGALFVDTILFKPSKGLDKRKKIVGYHGRLEKVKGVLNFVEAMPLILKERPDIEFQITGDGAQTNKVKEGLQQSHLNHKVLLRGWVPNHDEMPDYFNELKLLVVPSYSEGLPGTLLEAMACGTPALATPVGGIPEVIKDGETGFLLPDNSPQSIAQNVIRVLNYPNLAQIADNARLLIEREYSFQAAVERYRRILYGVT